jgi:Flp pilus assembly protein TadB
MHLASGDDDLLMATIANRDNVNIAIDKSSWVYSHSPTSMKSYLRQKMRHLSTATSYQSSTKVFLGWFSALHLGILLCAFVLLLVYPRAVLAVLGVKWLLQLYMQRRWISKVADRQYLFLFPIIEVAVACLYLFLSPYLWFHKKGW